MFGRTLRCKRLHESLSVAISDLDREPEDLGQFGFAEFFVLQQRASDLFQIAAMLSQQLLRFLVGFQQDLCDFLVDQFLSVLAELASLMNLTTQERIVVARFVTDRADFGTHAPVGDHPTCDTGGTFRDRFRHRHRFRCR